MIPWADVGWGWRWRLRSDSGAAGADSLGLCGGRDEQDVAHSEAIAEESDTPLRAGTLKRAAAREGLEGLGAECNGAPKR